MTDLRKAAEMALEGLETIKSSCREGRTAHAENEAAIIEHILRQALEQPKREWVGLTDEEIEDAWRYLEAIYIEEVDREGYWGCCNFEFVRAIEAKLKGKNT